MRTTARRLALTLLALAALALGMTAAAQAFPNGDVFVSVSNGLVNEYQPDGTFVRTLNTTKAGAFTTGMAFDATGNLYVTDFNANAVSKFDPTGTLLGDFGSGYNSDPESILFDAAGNAYVGQPDGSHQILKFDATGASLAAYSPSIEGRGTDWIDLAADQCTLLYAGEGSSIGSFDVCTNTQNPDFATGLTGSNAYALRILPDGSVLVADSSQIVHLDSTGAPIATYVVSGEANWFALNLDPDGTSFWSADFGTADVYHFDIATGLVLGHFNTGTGGSTVFGLAVRGERTAARPQLDLEPKTATNDTGQTHTLTATLTLNGSPQVGKTIEFTVTGANTTSGSAVTDASGVATFSYVGTNAGTDTITATYLDANGSVAASDTAEKTWRQAKKETTLTVAPGNGDYNDAATVSATLTDSAHNPVPGKTVTFSMGAESCSGTTDASGTATCSITPSEPAGSYPLNASFAGDSGYVASNGSSTFQVTLEETTIHYTGPTVFVDGTSATLSGRLLEDGVTPISGRTITLTLGSGSGAQSCTGTTDVTGNASCSIASVNQPAGPGTASADFASDGFYAAAHDSVPTLVAGATAGAFVIGNGNAAVGTNVTYWGAQWWKLNTLSGGAAPASFKGFATTPPSAMCGVSWSTGPGNSPPPPATVAPYIAVIVTSSSSQTGSSIGGNTVKVVIVKTNPGYDANPGHAGTGTVVATVCGS